MRRKSFAVIAAALMVMVAVMAGLPDAVINPLRAIR